MANKLNDFANSLHSAFDPSLNADKSSRPPVWLTVLLYFIALVSLFTPGLGTVVCVLFMGSWIFAKLKRLEVFGSLLLLACAAGLVWLGYQDVSNLSIIDEMAIIWHVAYSAFCVGILLILMLIRRASATP